MALVPSQFHTLDLRVPLTNSPCVLQLWFSNGPGVLVVDSLSLKALQRLDPYELPSTVVSMATSFSLWGEESVWLLDDHTNTMLLYHAASFQICAKYW